MKTVPNLFDLYKLIKENEVSAYTIYVDMDGVIADFDQRFIDLTKSKENPSGMTPNEYKDKYGMNQFWDFIDEENKVKFWAGIPKMDGAEKLINYVSKYDYEILTAPSIKKQSRIGKMVWLRKIHPNLFPDTPKVNFKSAKEKHKVKSTLTKTDILIDDKQSTIDNWDAAGGTGILYTSADKTIEKLEKLGL
jgi:5'(3')-deoxyribonucleotidase